jgi:hypothetical protein
MQRHSKLDQEAGGILGNVSPTLRPLDDVRRWGERINEALRAPSASIVPAVFLRGAG